MRINTSGNVGIGTNNPGYMLDVYTDKTSINNAIRIRSNTAREATLILERSENSWQVFHQGSGFGGAANNLTFCSSSNANVLDITQTGNVGIGIDDPRGKLDIYNGNLVVRATDEGGSAILYSGTPFVSALKNVLCLLKE
jgi:hypothetical protein